MNDADQRPCEAKIHICTDENGIETWYEIGPHKFPGKTPGFVRCERRQPISRETFTDDTGSEL